MSTNLGTSVVNIYYKLYLEQVLQLVSSLVIKSRHAVNQMNQRVELQGLERNPAMPETWKYYMNLNGEYHEMDETIYVTSQDTYEEIVFSKETLSEHLVTKRAYSTHGRFYRALVNKYPSQELLIKGILNPIPYGESIDARDHKILSYNTSLVEPQEQFLIPEIQEYIDGIYDRYFNEDYTRIEHLYNPFLDGIIFSNLPMQILLSRKRRRYTDLAHSYHIRMFLLSFAKPVGDEFSYLSKPQRLWLYRNLKRLNISVGTNETLDEVVRNVMNARGFPVVATELEFDYESIDESLNPEIKTQGVDIGTIHGESLHVGGVDDILRRQTFKAPMNLEYREYDRERFEEKYFNNRFDKLTTKVLESNIVDKTDADPFTLKAVLLNYWPFLASQGIYNSKLSFTVPSTGTVHQIDMMAAFVLYVYCVSAADLVELDHVPCLYIQRVLRITPPSYKELDDLRLDYTPQYFLEYIDSQIPRLRPMISVIAFNELTREIHRSQNDLRETRLLQGDYRVEGNLHQIIDRYYHSIEIHPYQGQDYDSWFFERDIEIETWSQEDYLEVASALFEKATGTSIDRGSAVKDLHSSMIRILEEMTSYSVQMVSTVNEDPIKVLDTKFPKAAETESIENNTLSTNPNVPYIWSVNGVLNQRISQSLDIATGVDSVSKESAVIDVDLSLEMSTKATIDLDLRMPVVIPSIRIPDTAVESVEIVEEEVTSIDYTPVDLIEVSVVTSSSYNQMTPERMQRYLGIE